MGDRIVALRKPELDSTQAEGRGPSLEIPLLIGVVSLLRRLREFQPEAFDAAVRRLVNQLTPVDSARPIPPGSDGPRPGAEGGHECPEDLGPPSHGVGIQNPFLRLPQVLAIIPVSRSTWWAGVQRGIYPKPTRLSPRTVAWRRTEIDALCARLADLKGGANSDPADSQDSSIRPGGDCR